MLLSDIQLWGPWLNIPVTVFHNPHSSVLCNYASYCGFPPMTKLIRDTKAGLFLVKGDYSRGDFGLRIPFGLFCEMCFILHFVFPKNESCIKVWQSPWASSPFPLQVFSLINSTVVSWRNLLEMSSFQLANNTMCCFWLFNFLDNILSQLRLHVCVLITKSIIPFPLLLPAKESCQSLMEAIVCIF